LTLTDGADLLGGGDGLARSLPAIRHFHMVSVESTDVQNLLCPAHQGLRIWARTRQRCCPGPGVINWDATVFKRFPLVVNGKRLNSIGKPQRFNHRIQQYERVTSFNATERRPMPPSVKPPQPSSASDAGGVAVPLLSDLREQVRYSSALATFLTAGFYSKSM
jgi:hypothetical protein